MTCSIQDASTCLFTEADLAWDPPAAPPTRIDLRLVKSHEEDSSPDILADLEAVTPHVHAPQPSPIPGLTFDASPPQHDVLAAHLLRRTAVSHEQHVHGVSSIQPIDWPCLPRFARRPSKEKSELSSPTDITWAGVLGSGSAPTPLSSVSLPSTKEEPCIDVLEEEIVLDGVKFELQVVQDIKKRISKPRRARKSATPQPSRFCHICARTQKSRKMFCANLNTEKKCRKAVCEPCFVELRWDFEIAVEGKEKWHCPHCRGMCGSVPRARCHIYTKTNEKRKASKRS